MLGSGRVSAEVAATVTSYLERVYWSMCETLPHESWPQSTSDVEQTDYSKTFYIILIILKKIVSLTGCFDIRLEVQETKNMDTANVRQQLLDALMNTALESDLSRGILWNGPGNLPRRWLPHGSYFDLYTLYCANQLASDQGVASKSTFYRVLASSGWKKKSSFLLPVPTQNVPPAVAWRAKSKVPKASRHIQRLAINCSDTLQGSSVTGRATGNVETGPKLPKTFYALFLTQWTVLSFPFHVFIVVERRKILKTQNDPHARWRRK